MDAQTPESLIPKLLAKEFSIEVGQAAVLLERLDQGLLPPYISHACRAEVGELTEGMVQRFAQRRQELVDLDLRRANIMRSLKSKEGADEKLLEAVQTCMDRFELEDLFVAHRRPEIEVQRAIDHGLEPLADRLVKSTPRPKKGEAPAADEAPAESSEQPAAEQAEAPEAAAPEALAAEQAAEAQAEEPTAEVVEALAEEQAVDAAEASAEETTEAPAEEPVVEAAEEPAQEPAAEAAEAPAADAAEAPAAEGTEAPAAEAAEAPAAEAPAETPAAEAPAKPEAPKTGDAIPYLHHGLEVTPGLARVCNEYVNTDRDVHNEEQALDGAMRLLSDRLGRDARLRGQIRKLLRKHGRLEVVETPSADPKRKGRYKALYRINGPIRQLQPHTLVALRQAQKERMLTTHLHLDGDAALERVRARLGRHTEPEFEPVLSTVARRALERRLLPMLEPDMRLELKERGDSGALRFLSKYLRRQLLAPPGGDRATIGVNVNARGDWILVQVDEEGAIFGPEITIETRGKEPAALAQELAPLVADVRFRSFAVGSGKAARTAMMQLREVLALADSDAFVFVVNDIGLSAWSNSPGGRDELPDLSVPARVAAGLARRFQDPLNELLKAEVRHLVHGMEQSHVSKAALGRALDEAVSSCVAFVGCGANTSPGHLLRRLPGISAEAVDNLLARRAAAPFKNREELREVLSEVEFKNAAGFLRISGGDQPLDTTTLHPEQYPLVERICAESGRSFDDVFGHPGGTKGLKRAAFGLDEVTWRDLVRELARPGRDPRPRIYIPRLLPADTDPNTLEKGQLVEGVVTNVASFGAFVDIGLARDAMVHVSDATKRYVRDAREAFAIGDIVRAKVLASKGPRVTLTAKDVGMDRPRHGAPARGRGRGGRGDRDGDRGRGRGRDRERRDDGPRKPFDPNLRAAQSRRDGAVVGGGASGGRGGGRGRGGKRPGGPGGDRRDRRGKDERVDRKDLQKVAKEVKFNPFADFFKEGEEAPKKEGEE